MLISMASVLLERRASSISGILLKEENAPTSGALLRTSSSNGAPVSMDTRFPSSSEKLWYSGAFAPFPAAVLSAPACASANPIGAKASSIVIAIKHFMIPDIC